MNNRNRLDHTNDTNPDVVFGQPNARLIAARIAESLAALNLDVVDRVKFKQDPRINADIVTHNAKELNVVNVIKMHFCVNLTRVTAVVGEMRGFVVRVLQDWA